MAKKRKAPEEKDEGKRTAIKEYFFAFEIMKKYPYSRSYIIKAPLKKSFKDTFAELFVGQK